MGTITGTVIVNKVATLLFDANNVKWARAELLGWLNDAQRAIVSMVPEAGATQVNVTLVTGTRQSLPADNWMLLEVTRNMGSAGTTPGRALQRVDKVTLDESQPTWRADTAAAVQTVYMYSLRDRHAFDVWPPSNAANRVEVIYSKMPTDIAEGSAIGIADIYQPAIMDYILSRAHSKGSPYADASKAGMYWQSFGMFIATNVSDANALTAVMGALQANAPATLGTSGAGS